MGNIAELIERLYSKNAKDAYEAALVNCKAKGIVEEALRWLEMFKAVDANCILTPLYQLLSDAL